MSGFVRLGLVLAFLCGLSLSSLGFEKVPREVAKALKIQRGKSIDAGLVFIDGKFLPPPYRVQRYGNQILINERPATGPIVAWEEFLKTQPAVTTAEVEKAPAAPAEEQAARSDESDEETPAAPKEDDRAPETQVRADSSESTTELDDLFDFNQGETSPAASAPTVESAPSDDVAPASLARPSVETKKTPILEREFVPNARSRALVRQVNEARGRIEATLRRGGYIFFGTKYRRVSGDLSGTKVILKKLPTILRDSDDVDSLYRAAQSAGLMVFLTYPIVQDLACNRCDFAKLMEESNGIQHFVLEEIFKTFRSLESRRPVFLPDIFIVEITGDFGDSLSLCHSEYFVYRSDFLDENPRNIVHLLKLFLV